MQLVGYKDLSQLSRGGMSTVYKAQQLSLNRTVAIKFLSAEFLWDVQVKKFFDQESLVIARLNHPNIIHIIDRGITPKGRPYFVMEFVNGRELSEITAPHLMSLNARIQLLMQTCKGMAFAHKNGVVHRDIKPANILVDDEDHVHILDFGIAWLEASGKPEGGEIVGTPNYMSPEQFSAPQTVSNLSDIYALGAVMFELFSGDLPTPHLDDLASPLKALPPLLSELIIQCLDTNPLRRPASADEVAFRLLKVLKGAHIKPKIKFEAQAAIGKLADKFKLLDVLSRSSFGAVYLFQDKTRDNLIVVKKRVKTLSGYEQACQLRAIDHNHIIKVLGTSKNDKSFIVVMEYLTGGSLHDRLSRPFTHTNFLKLAIPLCRAMQLAHEKSITHGDLRPSNILFDGKGNLKITDFGLEKHYEKQLIEDWYQPENKQIDPVSRDLYSAGCIFHHMLTGSVVNFKYGQLRTDKAFDALDSQLQKLLKNMIQVQSISRFQTFSDVLSELLSQQQKNQPEKTPLKTSASGFGWFLLILLVINLVGLVSYYFIDAGFENMVDQLVTGWF